MPAPGWRASSSPASHTGARAARPGYYSVQLNPKRGGAIGVELTATTRTGFGRFTFPASPHASILINAGGSAQPDDYAAVQIDPARREITGSASQWPLLRPAAALQGLLRGASSAAPSPPPAPGPKATLEPGERSGRRHPAARRRTRR